MTVGFDFKRRLGSGYFGEVWYANETGLQQECAVKVIPKNKIINQLNFFQEAQLLRDAAHTNIVEIYDTGNLNKDQIYLSMEFLEKGSLEDEASGGYIALTRAKKIMCDVLRGLEYAHSKKILHRDIKPANIMIGSNNEGKLSDFGLAIQNIGKLNLSFIKTHYQYFYHLAPEVNNFKDYSILSDIFACGITFYRLINGDLYLPNVLPHEIRNKIISGEYPDRNKYREFIPRSIKQFTNKAMNVNCLKRFKSAKDMRHSLEQIEVVNNWNETLLGNGYYWSISNKSGIIVLKREKIGNHWFVEVKKGKSKKSLRNISKFCIKNASKKEAEKISKKFLQDVVLGKL